jgi:hypothetical protein
MGGKEEEVVVSLKKFDWEAGWKRNRYEVVVVGN